MELNIIIGLICTILGLSISYTVMRHNMQKDSKTDGKESGTILTEIGYIKSSTDEIKSEQKDQRKTNTEMITRLMAVEASVKQLHKRVDLMEGQREHSRREEDI